MSIQRTVICPNCQARLLAPQELSSVTCKFCGKVIPIEKETSEPESEQNIPQKDNENMIDNPMVLESLYTKLSSDMISSARLEIRTLLEINNHKDTDEWIYDLIPSDNKYYGEALLAKSLKHITSQDPDRSRLNKAYDLLKQGLEYGVPDKSQLDFMLLQIAGRTALQVGGLCNIFNDEGEKIKNGSKTGTVSDAILGRSFAGSLLVAGKEGANNLKLVKAATELFKEVIVPHVYDIFRLAWINNPCKEIAQSIEFTVSVINDTFWIDNKEKQPFLDQFQVLLRKIREKYPPEKSEEEEKGKGCGCFIATATMQSPNHPYVRTLREFRDAILLPTSYGRTFISFYYKYSPRYARILDRSRVLRNLSRILLVKPLSICANTALNHMKKSSKLGG